MDATGLSGPFGAGSRRRFQWLVSVCLLAIAAWFLLAALEREANRAEQQSVRLMLNQLRSALVVKRAEVMLSRDDELKHWQGTNPMKLLRALPSNYVGACGQADSRRGVWCFAGDAGGDAVAEGVRAGKGVLAYRPRGADIPAMFGETPSARKLLWRVEMELVPQGSQGNSRATGLQLLYVKSGQKNHINSRENDKL